MKKIIFILIASVAFWSCEQDDPAEVAPQTLNPQIVVTPIVDISGAFVADTHVINSGSGQATFNLNRVYSEDNFFTLSYNGGDYTVPAASIQTATTFTAPAFLFDLPETYSGNEGLMGQPGQSVSDVSVVPFTAITKDDFEIAWVENRPADLIVFKNNVLLVSISEASIDEVTLYDRLPSIDEDMLTFVMDWEVGNDFDCRIKNASGEEFSYSGSTNRFEEVELENVEEDGTYFFNLWVWNGSDTVPTKVFVGHPNGKIEMFDLDFVVTGSYYSQEESILKIVKLGDNYTVSLL